MLLNFKIKNFRSIKDEVVLDLQATSDKTMKSDAVFEYDKVALLKCAAIYGPNASGKSNILKAFLVFRKMVLESLLRSNIPADLPSQSFKLSEETENQSSFFEITFLLDDIIFIYGFEIDKKRVTAEWLKEKKGNKILFERETQKIKGNKNYFKEATTDLMNQTTERVLFLSLLAANNKPIAKKIVEFVQGINYISGAKRGHSMDYSLRQFFDNPIMTEKIKNFIVKADFGIVDVVASEKNFTSEEIKNLADKFKDWFSREPSKIVGRKLEFLHPKYDKNNKGMGAEAFDFGEESDGTQQAFALSAPIFDTLEKGNILFVDEIDASLHPYLCQYLIKLFNSKEKNPKNAQLIFVTHDVSLLNEDFLRRDEIYFTQKNRKGATELFSLADISERKGVDFAKRYLEGRYNALPYIADFENLKAKDSE